MTKQPITSVLDQIVEQRAVVLDAQQQADEMVREATRRLGVLIAAADDDPETSVAAAARAMGVTKGYAHALLHRYRAGQLD